MNIVYCPADAPHEWNSSIFRCAIPAAALAAAGHRTVLVHLTRVQARQADALAALDAADVVVIERLALADLYRLIENLRRRGKVVVADFDDAYHLMPVSNPAFKFWGQNETPDGRKLNPPALEQFRRGLALCSGVVTPSLLLSADYQARHLPNRLPMERYRPHQRRGPRAPDAPIVLGWGGSVGHLRSWTESGLGPALRRVLAARPNVRLALHGSDGRIAEALKLPAGQVDCYPWGPYRDWPAHVARFDVGLAPLAGEYDMRRSWLKALEYLALGVPWLASAGGPYDALLGMGTLVGNTANRWETALAGVLDNLAEHQRQAAGFVEFAEAQDATRNAGQIIELFESLA